MGNAEPLVHLLKFSALLESLEYRSYNAHTKDSKRYEEWNSWFYAPNQAGFDEQDTQFIHRHNKQVYIWLRWHNQWPKDRHGTE